MASQGLSQAACSNAKPKAAIYYLRDAQTPGLRLCIRPTGSKLWMLRYRYGGKESTHGLGAFPSVGLAEARQKAREARSGIAEGVHPTTARRVRIATNVEATATTFGVICAEWLERNRPDWSGHHYERNEGLLRRILLDDLGRLPIGQITEPMLLATLRRAYDGGIRESARRARAVAAQVFQFAKDSHRATHNPALELARSSLLKRPEVTHFAAIKASEVGPLLRKMDEAQLEPVTRTALSLMLYTGMRDFSLRAAKWSEFDLTQKTWTVPAARMKSRREHVVPLPTQAVTLLKVLGKAVDVRPEQFVFTSKASAGFLAENTLRVALHRLGFKVTAHGFRSLITDVLNEQGFNADAIERQLDHVQKDKTRAAYLRSDFLPYRQTMMQWLADWADAQRSQAKCPAMPKNVLSLRRAA